MTQEAQHQQGGPLLGRFLLLLLIAITLFWACEDNPVDLNVAGRETSRVLDTLYATFDRTDSLDVEISTLASSRLLLGGQAGYTFKPIMRFAGLSDSSDIDSAWIIFPGGGARGVMPTSFSAFGYPITQTWILDTDSVWNDYDDMVDLSDVMGEMTVTPADSDTIVFNFSAAGLERIRGWADTSLGIDNFGMALDFTGEPSLLKELTAKDLTGDSGPKLIYGHYGVDSTGADVFIIDDSLLVGTDAFKFFGNFSDINGLNHISTFNSPRVTIVEFDIDSLNRKYPDGITVLSANVRLFLDRSNSVINPDFGANLQLLPLTSPADSMGLDVLRPSTASSSLFIFMNRFASDTSFVEIGNGTERQDMAGVYIQQKMADPEVFQAFYIEHGARAEYLSIFSCFRYDDPGPGTETDVNRRTTETTGRTALAMRLYLNEKDFS